MPSRLHPGAKIVLFALFLFCAGGLSSLAMAPHYLWPLLMLGLSALYSLWVVASRPETSFLYGWAFGFGYFLFGLSWIANALLVEGNPYAWAWPLAVAGLPFFLAFFPAFGLLVARLAVPGKRIAGYAAFLAGMFISEWLRGHILTGFPWNLYGYVWPGASLAVAQTAAFGDIYLLSLLTLFWFSLPGFLLVNRERLTKPKIWLWPVFAALIFLGCYIYGHARLKAPDSNSGLRVKIVQANIGQAEKWDPDKMLAHYLKHLRMSAAEETGNDAPVLLLWPETAITDAVLRQPHLSALLQDMLGTYAGDIRLLTGMLIREENGDYRNAIVEITKDGSASWAYYKHHLVPFGEYIPFQDWIPLQTVTGFSGFKPGGGPQSRGTEFSGISFSYSPAVCYEVIFPRTLVEKNINPHAIINVTNDGWYGITAGPYQHLDKARMRAIEEGIPVLRAAGTGISAVIDPFGRVIASQALDTEGVVTAYLPARSVSPAPLYFLGSGFLCGLCFAMLMLLAALNRRNGTK